MVTIATGLRWFMIVSAAILQLVHCNPVDDQLTVGRIVGGQMVDISLFPYQVSLQTIDGVHFCGGSIIGHRHILTAWNCVVKRDLDEIQVSYGRTKLTDTGSTVNIQAIYIKSDRYDAAIIKLVSEIKVSNTAQIVKLATNEPVQDGLPLIVTGWGSTKEGGQGSNDLLSAVVNLIYRGECLYRYLPKRIDPTMICALAPGKGVCDGDFGGPLVSKENGEFTQVGIVSWGTGCADPYYPGVYTNVASLLPWIEQVLSF